jgi:hypothetical protein
LGKLSPKKNPFLCRHCPKRGGGGSDPNPNCSRHFFFCLDMDIFQGGGGG